MKKILVVDDEELIRELTCSVLYRMGYECRAASNGKEALDIIDSGFAPDLVITDVNMPVLNGLGLARQLRQKNIQIPVVFMSGNLMDIKLEDLQAFSPYLLDKPFVSANLETFVRLAILEHAPVGPEAA